MLSCMEHFSDFVRDCDYSIDDERILSIDGNIFYPDLDCLELNTPPIVINRGFASRLADSILIGRDRVANSFEDCVVSTGSSMHWNLNLNSDNKFMYGEIALPFSFFGLTPLSVGFNLRQKHNIFQGVELLGDHVDSSDQLRATSLLLGAYTFAVNCGDRCPMKLDSNFEDGKRQPHPLLNGRKSLVNILSLDGKNDGIMQAQEYLSHIWDWILPYAKILGTDDEVSNLEGFIEGKSLLEIDKIDKYIFIKENGGKIGGIYFPIKDEDGQFTNTIHSEIRDIGLPLECALLAEIAKRGDSLDFYGWKHLNIRKGGSTEHIQGIGNIYNYCDRFIRDKDAA